MEASRNKLEADRQFGEQNVESIIEARASKYAFSVALFYSTFIFRVLEQNKSGHGKRSAHHCR